MNKTIGIVIATLMLFACGQQKNMETSGQEAAPAAESQEKMLPDVATKGMGEMQVDPAIRGCLDLVKRAQWAEAVETCLQAEEIAPDNAEVQTALAQARTEAAKASAEAAAAKSAANLGEAMPEVNPDKALESETPTN